MPGKGRADEGKEREGHEGDPWAILSKGNRQRPLQTKPRMGPEPICAAAKVARASLGLGVRDFPGSAASWLPGHFLRCEMGMS